MRKHACLFLVPAIAVCTCAQASWEDDFTAWSWQNRPALEVCYTDGSRTAFEVNAEAYRLRGELRKPHRLLDAATGEEWLSLEVIDASGTVYASVHATPDSRINLYRRGPYFCEVHWFDIQTATADGALAPLKGDLALYCYPDKLLASITWHAMADFPLAGVRVKGLAPASFDAEPLAEGEAAMFAFPLFGETIPLPPEAFENIEATAPMYYDTVRGCYTIGTVSEGGFQGHFFHHPNRYETARFRVTNDDRTRTLYICHETVRGNRGSVEGGVLLDEDGHPLPITVQISKNFAGEKEEPFYNPEDTPFSETYFPLTLEPGESREITSLHLYQNWGRHMVKQFSSLGAWMDYFHSSTGVTETTCYVPFKFGGLPGVDVADFRAMSQATFWGGQPQHDNIAGHSFLSYKTGEEWQYLTYRGTTYRSTGPNWMDIGFEYLSTDGRIRATIDTFELPQSDELRNFIRVRYEALGPIEIDNARELFRMATIATWVQRLRYTHVAATGMPDTPLTFESNHFALRGHPIPSENAFMAVYGEPMGSNALVLRSWNGPFGPAVSLWCEEKGDTRLLLVPDTDSVRLDAGDVIEFDAFWLPYGPYDSAETPRRETVAYGSAAPRIVEMMTGTKESDFPARIRAENNRAEFTLEGGRDLVPIIVTGLTDYRWPRIFQRENGRWRDLLHNRVGPLDGVEVFTEPTGTFGAVFLVDSDNSPQPLRVTVGEPHEPLPRISLRLLEPDGQGIEAHPRLAVLVPGADTAVSLGMPVEMRIADAVEPLDIAPEWQESEGGSWWFEQKVGPYTVGARVSPNEDNLDLEVWLGNDGPRPVTISAAAELRFPEATEGGSVEERGFVLTETGWARTDEAEHDAVDRLRAVTSNDGTSVIALAWPDHEKVSVTGDTVRVSPVWPECPPGRRAYVRGKLYIIRGRLADLAARAQREVRPRSVY